MDQNILKHAREWATSPVFDVETRAEIDSLLQSQNEKELTERFYRDLEFGTGGLRGILGAGTSRMNIYNVRKASAALSQYINQVFSSAPLRRVAISYDSRRFSREFAEAAAGVFAAYGIEAYITKELRPVPMLSFMVRKYECVAGVCITASHNPPNYNGYKVYWATGGQIVPPHDKEVIQRYLGITSYESISSMPFIEGVTSGKIREIGVDLDDAYFAKVKGLSLRSGGRDGFKIVYSPLHGTGAYPVTKALDLFGFKNVAVVPEQEKPDGDFPTVKSPNPEDPEALSMAVALARKLGADLVLATDPDSDRIGFVVREGHEFVYFNGNQIGCLLVEYVLSSLKDNGRMPQNPLVIKTIVTTDLERDIAAYYGAHCDETLTGFKWICQVIEEYENGQRQPRREYVCGGEESYGFLMDSFVRDKDGVSSCAIAAEMVAWYKSQGLTPTAVLDRIFRRHGVYQESLYTITLPGMDGAQKIAAMMQRLRQNPPRVIDGVKVTKLRDLQNCQTYDVTDVGIKPSGSIDLPPSDVLQFLLADGTKVSARPSGTEPKIKFYVSVRQPIESTLPDDELQKVKAHCRERTQRIEATFTALAQ